jgi:putative zinc finger protein
MRCDDVRTLAPEIALGIADGEERAEALRHLSGCADCRRLVDELSGTADELLLVAPSQDPPAGFESRVLDAMGPERPPRRRRARRLLTRLGPPVAAAAATAVALIAVYHDDRLTADRYRDTLDVANGTSFQAARVEDKTGARAGVVFGYRGSPSWLLVTVDREHRRRVAAGELVTTGGRTIPLRSLDLDKRQGSWGGAIPVDLYEVASVRLLGETPGEVLEASFRSDDP